MIWMMALAKIGYKRACVCVTNATMELMGTQRHLFYQVGLFIYKLC